MPIGPLFGKVLFTEATGIDNLDVELYAPDLANRVKIEGFNVWFKPGFAGLVSEPLLSIRVGPTFLWFANADLFLGFRDTVPVVYHGLAGQRIFFRLGTVRDPGQLGVTFRGGCLVWGQEVA